MADQKININIGTSWNGAGMNKAMGAVQTLSQTAGKAAGAVGRLGSVFEGIGGQVSKSVGAIASFAGAFATGGVVGLAIAGVTALAGAWQKHNAELEEAKKKAKELELEKISSSIRRYGDEIATATGKLNAMTSALVGFANARQKTLMMRGSIEAQQIRMNAEGGTDEDKAKANLEATKIEQQSVVDAAKAGITNAEMVSDAAAKSLRESSIALEKLKEEYSTWKEQVTVGLKQWDPEIFEKYEKGIADLTETVNKNRNKDIEATHGVLLAREVLKKALLDQERVVKKATDDYEAATPEGQYRKHLEQMSAQFEGNKEERNQGQERERMINEGKQYL